LGFKVFKLEESNFKQWREDIKNGDELEKQMEMFIDNVKTGGKQYFVIDDGRLIISLTDKIAKPLVEKITEAGKLEGAKGKRCEKFLCLDRAFGNNDQLKINTALQAEAAKIEFKVI